MPPKAASFRAFFYASALLLFLGLALLLRSFGIVGWQFAEILSTWLFLLHLITFTLAYLNYVPVYSSFYVKFVGITLATLLAILTGISWLVGSVYVENYKSPHFPKSQTALRFEPSENNAYSIRGTGYYFSADLGSKVRQQNEVVPIPFSFPFYGKSYDFLYPRLNGMVGLNELPVWRDIQHNFGSRTRRATGTK